VFAEGITTIEESISSEGIIDRPDRGGVKRIKKGPSLIQRETASPVEDEDLPLNLNGCQLKGGI